LIDSLHSVGKARVLKGNSKTIGNPTRGAFNYGTNPVRVQAGSGIIIPEQFGYTNATIKPYIGQISGRSTDGRVSFTGVSDVIGGNIVPTLPKDLEQYKDLNLRVRDVLQLRFPDTLIIELPSIPKDPWIVDIELTLPNQLPCPTGTIPG
ncbi:MAG: hypothetical protein ACHQIM_22015, partial [Sphingobacteriales bacterium]